MGITATVENKQITASVGESKIDVSVGGGFGPSGAPGSAGQAATIAVGTVTTGAAGSQATVTNVGTSSAAVLNFTIPAGATGPQGPAGGGYTLPVATASVLGGVKIGSGISIDGSGVISASAGYTLPTATDSVLGGVKIGSGVTITDGVISVSTNYAATSHSHTFGEVSTASTYTNFLPEGGDLATALSGIDSAISGKAASSHAHATSEIKTAANVFLTDMDAFFTSYMSSGTAFFQGITANNGITFGDSSVQTTAGAAALHAHNVGDLSLTATDVIVGRYSSGAGVGQEITCTAAGRAILDDADASAQRTTLGLGTAATSASTDFAAASHTHAVTTGLTAGNWKIFHSNGSGGLVELAVGASGTVLKANGTTSAPTFSAIAASQLPVVLEQTEAVGNSGSTKTLSLTTGSVQTVTLSASCTFTMPSATAGASITLILTQGSNYTATFTGVKWPGGTAPTITATTNAIDVLVFLSDGTNWYGVASQKFS